MSSLKVAINKFNDKETAQYQKAQIVLVIIEAIHPDDLSSEVDPSVESARKGRFKKQMI